MQAGLNVVRFGMMREQVLGLEVVLPNGQVLSMMHGVIKNNAGYDLKQLFIGSEGTLGIVTRVNLRLRFLAHSVNTALLAVPSFENAIELLHRIEARLCGSVTAFEVMWPDFYERVSRSDRTRAPLREGYPLYVVIEALSSGHESEKQKFLSFLSEEMENEAIIDAVIANSESERETLFIKIRPHNFEGCDGTA